MVDGGLYVRHKEQHPNPKPIPVMIIQGTDDPCFPYKGGQTHGPNIGGSRMFRGQPHGISMSTDEALSFWCLVNHCRSTPQTNLIPHVSQDHTSTTYELFSGAEGNDVAAYIVTGGGHCWPGGRQYFPVSVIGKTTNDFSASEAIWQFFAAHSPRVH
jgi:polyhydroxybutyrate depolymerase